MNIIFTIVVVIIAIAGSASAEPIIGSVSGAFSNQSSIAISGSNFGSKSSAAPAKWDDFSNGTDGSNVANGWTLSANTTNPKYSTTYLRTNYRNKDMSVHLGFTGGQYRCQIMHSFGTIPPDPQRIYVTFWSYLYEPGGSTANFKAMRIYGNGSDETYMPPGASFAEGSQIGTYPNTVMGVYDSNLSETGKTVHANYSMPRSQWNRIEYYVDSGTQGNTDGKVQLWTNGILRGQINPPTRPFLIDSARFVRVDIGQYYDGSGSGMDHYVSDAYIDTTLARVEIGNAATWSGCTHREIQIPSAWDPSGTFITVTVNQGAFANGDTAYLYVVDSNGQVNTQGFQITIGGDAPVPPKNLRIVN